MSSILQIEEFDEYQPASPELLAELHAKILPSSPLVRLGRRFMQRFYYGVLPQGGYIFGAVARVEGKPAAFVVATQDSCDFLRTVAMRHWPRMAFEATLSLLTDPTVLRGVPEVLSLMKARFIERRQRLKRPRPAFNAPIPDSGEILSIGTLPEFQSRKVLRALKVNPADELLKFAVTRLQERGTRVVRAVVDADNKPAQFFYHCRGWRREVTPDAGWNVPVVEFICEDCEVLSAEP